MYFKSIVTLMLIAILWGAFPQLISSAWASAGYDSSSIQPEVVLTQFFAIIISLTIHEFAHAWVADKMGDPTPGRYGRLNLNPITIIKAHPFGAFLVPLIGSMNGFLFGMAATPVNPHLVKRKYTLRQAERWISFAGPLSNVILAIVATMIYIALAKYTSESTKEILKPLLSLSGALITTNIILALFNLIPVPPLDGFTVLQSSIPKSQAHVTEMINQYKNMIIIFVIFFGGELIMPAVIFIQSLLIRTGVAIFSMF